MVEVAISMALFSILVVSVFSIALETSNFIGETDTAYNVQAEVSRAYLRLSEVLRKSGWNSAGGVTYPRVLGGGNQLRFRLLTDLDGNGYAFDAATGELEWGAEVYTVRLDPSTRTLAIYAADGTELRVLGRHIDTVNFATYLEDNTLHLKEVQVTIQASQTTKKGDLIQYDATSSVHMRN
jgi:hypothetical protein